MDSRSWRRFALGLVFSCAAPLTFAEDHGVGSMREEREVRDSLLNGPALRLRELNARHLPMSTHSTPNWIRIVSRPDFDAQPSAADDGPQLVLQRKRRDGAELLTLRYPVAASGRLQTFAGVGFNRAVYFTAADAEPTTFNKRNRHRSIGGAAEAGIALRLTEQVSLTADLRWIEIDGDAVMLRTDKGLVAADPTSIGVSLAWRFR